VEEAIRTESKGAPTVSEQEVLDLVQRWAAVELRGDADGHGDLLAPDFVGVGPVGFVLTAKEEGRWVLANIQLSGPLIPSGTMPPFAR